MVFSDDRHDYSFGDLMEIEYDGTVECICPKCKHKFNKSYAGMVEIEPWRDESRD